MKTSAFFIIALFLGITAFAQTPQSFRYQVVARDNSGQVLANQAVSFRISILSGSVSGTEVYVETHTGLLTNAFGLVELEIGKGTPVTGTFSTINWGSSNYFVNIEMDPAGGTEYQELSTSQLLSVPFAMHAKTVETGDNWGTQVVVRDATLTGNGTVAQPLSLADNAVTSAKIADGTITSADLGSNSVTSAKITDGTIVAADIASNAISTAKVANNAVTVEKIADGAITGAKIAQQSAVSGQVLKWDGATWKPASDEPGIESNPFFSSGGITRNRFLTDHFVFGSTSLDDVEGSDDNKRMFFNKTKGAFRAGESVSTYWDDADVGINSVAFGYGSRASGLSSLAAGRLNWANGTYSTALGSGTYAMGTASTAMGRSTKAPGDESISMGYNSVARALTSVAMGRYNLGLGNTTTWIETDPVLEIGIGSSDTDKANAMTVLKNGNVGIGPANPAAKLEVAGQVKITGGSPGAGKILTSDAGGLATWQKLGTLLPIKDTLNIYRGALIEAYNTCDDEHSDPVGILGVSLSENENWGTGVRGIVNGTKGSGVMGGAWALTGVASGVTGYSNSLSGAGVYGYTTATQGNTFGVKGETNSPYGYGIYGISKGSTGGTGVWGACYSTDGYSGYFSAGKFYVGGNAGFGTSSPAALLHAEGTGTGQGNVVFVGQYKESSPGNPPVSGAGTRMMWYPDKAAFRAGRVSGAQWDKDSVGIGSVAFGTNTKAKGSFSTAMGNSTTVTGVYSTAMGYSATASGISSTAMGSSTMASGNDATAMGASTIASGNFSTAMGSSTTASGFYSTAMGNSTTASNFFSTAMGGSTIASGYISTAMGASTNASGDFSTAMGYYTIAPSFCETAIGTYNTDYSPKSINSWNAGDRLFVIGNGTGSTAKSNAFTILKNGNVGIGPDNPTAKLEVAGQVKITGGSPGAGKVLTSDASGLASWETLGNSLPIRDTVNVSFGAVIDVVNNSSVFLGSRVIGIRAEASSTGDTYSTGVQGESASKQGRGVVGSANSQTGETFGVYGIAYSSSGIGVYGRVMASSGNTSGVKGVTSSPIGFGVVGEALATTGGTGVYGACNSADGYSGYFNNGKFYVSGNAGFGTTLPTQKLHIKGSAVGNAVLFIEPNKWNAAGDYGEIRFGDANHYIRGEHTNGMTFYDTDKFNFTGGNVGIGTANPGYKLDVSGNRIRLIEAGTNDWIAMRTDGGSNDYLDFSWGGGSLVMQGSTTNENIILNPSMNKVGIRTWSPMYDLDVTGNIRATGSVYYGGTSGTANGILYTKPDYVFAEDYETMSVSEVEDFLKHKNHLPWVTSAKQEKQENGEATDMTRMAFETLETVENLQLQIISQQRLIKEQQTKIESLQTRLEQIEKTLKTSK